MQGCTEVTSGAGVGGKGPRDERVKPDPCFTLLFTFTEIFSRPGQVFPVSHGVSAEDHVSVCPGLGVRGWRYCKGTGVLSLLLLDRELHPPYSTTVDPREKLEVLEKTYGEIESTVSRVLGREHKLPMDDLLPLLIYVVSRAR